VRRGTTGANNVTISTLTGVSVPIVSQTYKRNCKPYKALSTGALRDAMRGVTTRFEIRAERKASGDSMPEKVKPFANTDEFYIALGGFYAAWRRTDLAIDCAIWKALETATPEQVHERVASMTFGCKCEYFRSLLATSKFKKIETVKDLLTRITDHSMRNVFAHSFLASDEHSVAFIHRKSKRGQYQVNAYQITRDQFLNHVSEFAQLSLDFEKALGLSDKEVRDFGAAALPLATGANENCGWDG
jgi:hypothetical protein